MEALSILKSAKTTAMTAVDSITRWESPDNTEVGQRPAVCGSLRCNVSTAAASRLLLFPRFGISFLLAQQEYILAVPHVKVRELIA